MFGPATVVSHLRDTLIKRDVLKLQSKRGIAEISDRFRIHVCKLVTVFVILMNAVERYGLCLLSVSFSQVARLPLLATESKRGRLPCLVGVRYYTPTGPPHTPVLQLCPISEWRSQ